MNNLFVAKFAQVSNTESFRADKRGNLPFIGDILAGISIGSLINGTIFQRDYEEGQPYLCENFTDPDYPDYPQVRVLMPINGYRELSDAMKDLGAGRLVRPNAEATGGTVVQAEIIEEPEVINDEAPL